MKSLLSIFVVLLLSFNCYSQQKVWILCTPGNQHISSADTTLQLVASLTTTSLFTSVTWTQPSTQKDDISGQGLGFLTNTSGVDTLKLHNLSVGVHVFTATGVSKDGMSGSYTDSVYVSAAPPRPVYYIIVSSDSSRKISSF